MRIFDVLVATRMKKWAILILTYPVIFILALIFIGPTLPIDMSILVISAIMAAVGLSKEPAALAQVRGYFLAWRSKVLLFLKG